MIGSVLGVASVKNVLCSSPGVLETSLIRGTGRFVTARPGASQSAQRFQIQVTFAVRDMRAYKWRQGVAFVRFSVIP